MILADKIINLRKKAGMSQEELADKMSVSRQAVSKWESAQSVPDLNRILKLSEIFGVSTDYLLKDEVETEEFIDTPMEDAFSPTRRVVTLEEADSFLKINKECSGKIALGVGMCILSPLLMILLGGLGEFMPEKISEMTAMTIGLPALFILIAGAVGLFILTWQKLRPFEYLEKEDIETAYGVEGMVRERQERLSNTHIRDLIIGIALCILAAIPIFVVAPREDYTEIYATCLTLIMVAVGVFIIVQTSIVWGGFQKLLEEGDYNRDSKKAAPIMGIYWTIVTAIFLAYSFITMDWQRSWIIWPVAGVLCGIIYEVMKLKKQ